MCRSQAVALDASRRSASNPCADLRRPATQHPAAPGRSADSVQRPRSRPTGTTAGAKLCNVWRRIIRQMQAKFSISGLLHSVRPPGLATRSRRKSRDPHQTAKLWDTSGDDVVPPARTDASGRRRPAIKPCRRQHFVRPVSRQGTRPEIPFASAHWAWPDSNWQPRDYESLALTD